MESLYRETKWLRFFIVEEKPKTLVIHIKNKSNQFLGTIKWYPSWRQYTYNAFGDITFNHQCLKDIADVLTSLNEEHKRKRKVS